MITSQGRCLWPRTFVVRRFSWIRNVLWDRLKANISRLFQIYHIPLLKLFFFHVKTMRNNSETDRNTVLHYTRTSHDTTNGFYL